jgi:hypothetical protein
LLTTTTADKNGFYAFSSLELKEYIVACLAVSYKVTVVVEQVTRADFEFD